MEELAEPRESWLRKWLKLPNGIPCANTFSRVIQAIELTAFAECIATHLGRLGFEMQGGHAINGKALRGSRSGQSTHLHAVSTWVCEAEITLAQAFVGEKTNEITAIPELLEMLNLKGAVVTIDTMGTQRAIAHKIADMSSLKGVNAPEFLAYIRNHWGIENRCHWVLDAIYREDHNQTRDRNSAANHSILRRMALNAHNRMPYEGKKRKSLPKR